MRLRKNRRFIFLFLSILALTTHEAQTLYWVGGSGNFNDPGHWSLVSGGNPSGMVPGKNAILVLDNNSGSNTVDISLTGINYVKSINFNNDVLPIKILGESSSELHVFGDFQLNHKTKLLAKSKLFFSSLSGNYNTIRFAQQPYEGDVTFEKGNWKLNYLNTSGSVNFISGTYKVEGGYLKVKNFSSSGNAKFDIKRGVLDVMESFNAAGTTAFSSDELFIRLANTDPQKFHVDPTVSLGKKYSVSTINTVCGATLSSIPISCSGTCDGQLILQIDAACTPSPYTLGWSNPSCPTPTLTNVGPGTYTITGLCSCADYYSVVVFDNLGNILTISNAVNINGQSAINFIPFNPIQPTCNGLCNGSINGNLSGAVAPYTVTINSTSVFAVSSGNTTYTNLCAGVNTFVIMDTKGCVKTFTPSLGQPAVLTTGSVTSNVTCNGACNGFVTLSPSGGNTGGYTVTFAPGGTFAIASGGSASINSLCPTAISATVTDTKGCSITRTTTIIEPPPLSITSTQTNVICNGSNNGAAAVLVSGGTPTYAFSWAPASGSTNSISGLSAGGQTVTITDQNSCVQTVTFNITQPPAITVTPTFTNIVCSGSCTGVASISATGGTGVFTHTWIAPGPLTISTGTVNTIANLCAGSYTVLSMDINSCSPVPVVITITQPSSITLSTSSKSISCFGANDGSATVTASGGNGGPYGYTWTPGGFSTPVITNLGPNTYTISVSDASSCAKSATVSIIEPAGLVPNVTFTNLTCNSGNAPCDGKINSLPSGGVAPYSYTLMSSSSTNTNSPPYTGLCAGTYTVIVKDASACPQQSIITLGQPSLLLPTISTTSVTCYGGNNGGLTGSPGTGGTATYNLVWTTPTGTAGGAILSNQIAGNYTLTVIDSRSCTAQATASVAQPSSITISVASSTINCFSVCSGTLGSAVSGGAGGYTYTWTSTSATVGNAPTATSLCPGPYTLTVADANTCTRVATGSVSSPPAITLTVATTPVNCFGDFNGSATVTTAGGTPPFTFQFNSSPIVTNTTGILSAQPSGTYNVNITDNAGCTTSTVLTIASPTALAAVLNGTGSCNVCNGSATVTPSFGTGPYSVSWASSLGGSFPTTQTISSLCAGNYTATITDAKNCVITKTISLSQIITITVNVAANSILCNGATTGSATAQASGGTGSYTYSWTPSGQTSNTLTNAGANTYTVRVTDTSTPSNCSYTATVTFTQPPAMTVTPTQTNVICNGFSTGAASVNVSGGTPGSSPPYTYSWSPGGQTTNSLTGIPSGTYILTTKDGNLCTVTNTIVITQPPSIAISVSYTNPSGCVSSLANGVICATASAGSGSGYTYTLNPNGFSTTATPACFSSLGGGAYSILVKDGSGCSSSTVISLSPPSGPTIAVASVSVACFGGSTGVVSATASGVGPFTFNWTPTVTATNISPTSTGTNVPQGVYFVTATDVNSCSATQAVTVTQAPAYTLNPVVTNLRCNAVTAGSIVVAPAGGTSPYTYSWTAGTGTMSGQGTASITGLSAGVFTLNLSDAHSCVVPYTFTVSQPAAINVTAVTTSVSCYNACNGSIVANASGGTGALNYNWTPMGINSQTVTNLCATTGTNPPSYTLTVIDQNTCSIVNTYTIGQPTQLTNTVNIVSASCSNSCNAIATQTVSGGVGGYNYSWSSSTVTTSSLGSLCGGTYTAIVTDANSCTATKAFTVTPPAPLNVTLTAFNPLCNGACNGSISTAISGAQGAVSYSWSPSGIGQNPTGLCAVPVPNYTLIATDSHTCSTTAVITLTNPPALIAVVNFTNPLCHNNSNGFAAVSVSNAVGALNYTWVPTGPPSKTTQAVSGLASGSYTVMVKDGNNCQASQTFTLANPTSILINISMSPASCSQSNGAVTANPSGGTPGSPTAYTFTWTGVVSNASVVTGIPAGSYTVAVSDGLGCTSSTNVLLSNSSGPSTIPIVSSSIICNAQCTGAASVDVSGIVGGTSPYTISWVSPSSTLNALTNLCAGSYAAQVLDATGCLGFTNVVIAEPAPISNAPTIGYPLCRGICNGSITLNTTGGNAPYTYSWSPISSSSSVVTNLCAGDYTVAVMYNGVCTETSVISLPDQSSISIVPTVTNNTCYGTCNGAIDLAVTGGNGPYSAGWSNSQTGLSLSNLCNNTYTVIITDFNGCKDTATAAITSGPPMTSTTSIVPPSCGVCDGSASVSVSGGLPPLTYVWSNSATTPSISNLCAGIYQVVVTDAVSCSMTHTVIVNSSNGIAGENFNVQEIPCSGLCVGAITVNPIGGTAPISYNWTNTNPVGTSSVISNLCPGTYYVQMQDSAGCIRTSSVSINPLVTMTVSPFIFLPTCNNSDGSISIIISGGTPTYNIVWNPPAGLTTSLTNLNAGIYSYTVTESSTHSCAISNTINLSDSDGPTILFAQTDVNCFNQCTGSITANASGTNTPITYAWSTGVSTPTIGNLCKGVVTLTVTDAGGCKSLKSFTITDNPLLQLGISNVYSPNCYGDCTGSISLVPNGGVPPYTYSWTNTSAVTNPVQSLCDGSYIGTVIDSKGCTSSSSSYVIASASAMSLAINTTSSSCTAVADGAITLAATGGKPEYIVTWNGPSSYTAATSNISNLFSGTYSANVVDNLGCVKDTAISIVPSITVTANAGDDKIICPQTGTVMLSAGSTGGSSYKWFALADKQRKHVLGSGDSYLVQNLSDPAGFVLVATATVASCYSEDSVFVDLFSQPAVDAGRDVLMPIYSATIIGGHPSTWSTATYTWMPDLYISDSHASNPVASNTVNMTYTLTITDANGCISSDSVHVNLYPELKISSGFTPNNDGKNDTWIIDYVDQFPNVTVEIFNRWGDVIFSSTGYQEPFDGKYKGADLPVGTYYYVININHPGYTKPITGPLTIFR